VNSPVMRAEAPLSCPDCTVSVQEVRVNTHKLINMRLKNYINTYRLVIDWLCGALSGAQVPPLTVRERLYDMRYGGGCL